MGFVELIGNIYTELLKLVGNIVLVLAGIAGCAFATVRQYEPMHSTQENTAIFLLGIALVVSSWVRRFVWTCLGLAVPWALLVAGALYLLTSNPARFEFSPVVLLVVVAPPIFGAFMLELRPKPPAREGRDPLRPTSDS